MPCILYINPHSEYFDILLSLKSVDPRNPNTVDEAMCVDGSTVDLYDGLQIVRMIGK